MRRTKFILHS